MFRWTLILLAAVVIAGGIAWHLGFIGAPWPGPQNGTSADQTQTVEVGGPLFAATDIKPAAWKLQRDDYQVELVMPDFQTGIIDKQDVTSIAGDSNKTGLILFIGEEVHKEKLLGSPKDEGLMTA